MLDLDKEEFQIPALQIKIAGQTYDIQPTPNQVMKTYDIMAANGFKVRGDVTSQVIAAFTGEDAAEDRLFSRLNFKAQDAIGKEIVNWLQDAMSRGKKKDAALPSQGSAGSTESHPQS